MSSTYYLSSEKKKETQSSFFLRILPGFSAPSFLVPTPTRGQHVCAENSPPATPLPVSTSPSSQTALSDFCGGLYLMNFVIAKVTSLGLFLGYA
jgi:hypothetical protein